MQLSILTDSFPYTHSRGWVRAFHTHEPTARRALIKSLFTNGNYIASVDFPPSLFVEDLVAIYPNAKFILTTRKSAQAWRASFDATVDVTAQTWWRACMFMLPSMRLVVDPMAQGWEARSLEMHGDTPYRTTSVKAYESHNAWVKRVVPKERLLDVHEDVGWEKLCGFLGRDAPEGPYPRTNERAELVKWFNEGAMVGLAVWGMWIVGLGAAAWWFWR